MTPCSEPSIHDMLNDPIVRALMAADGVDLGELQRLLQSIAENLTDKEHSLGIRPSHKKTGYVRFGSKADMCSAIADVRFTSNSGHYSPPGFSLSRQRLDRIGCQREIPALSILRAGILNREFLNQLLEPADNVR